MTAAIDRSLAAGLEAALGGDVYDARGAQAVEDAACLVFIETQLADVSTKLDRDHLIDVIRKTARKMTPAALDAVASIPLGAAERQLLADALA